MKINRVKKILIILLLILLLAGCAPLTETTALTRAGDELDLDGAKIIVLSSGKKDKGFNEEEVISQINLFLARDDVEIITFSRFYDPVTSRLIRCEIIYRNSSRKENTN